jgi:hypothetical protein
MARVEVSFRANAVLIIESPFKNFPALSSHQGKQSELGTLSSQTNSPERMTQPPQQQTPLQTRARQSGDVEQASQQMKSRTSKSQRILQKEP